MSKNKKITIAVAAVLFVLLLVGVWLAPMRHYAGADLLLEPDDLEAAYEGVLKAVKKGDITEDRLDESIYRILRVKLSMQDESSDTTESESVSDY